jgi:hypothetical protein
MRDLCRQIEVPNKTKQKYKKASNDIYEQWRREGAGKCPAPEENIPPL